MKTLPSYTNTVDGQLEDGLEFNGQIFKDFTLRSQLIKDTLGVHSAYPEALKDNVLLSLVLLSRVLIKIGDIPAEAVTVELLGELTERDYHTLLRKQVELKKR